jgi:phospholipase/lecithinase/hemolysin
MPSSRLDEHDQEKQLPFETTGNHTKNITVLSQHTNNSNHPARIMGLTGSSRSSSGGEEPAAHLRRRRTRSSQEQVQEVKDQLGAEPGGEGKPEASHHQQQATEAVNNTITIQLQATGRNLAHHC